MNLNELTDNELLALKRKTEFRISKYKNKQLAKKVQLNSAYGALGNEYFRFFDVRQATAITISGQLAIRWIERKLNAFMNRIIGTEDEDFVVAIDTDSVYICMDKLVQTFGEDRTVEERVDLLDKACENVFQGFIDKSYQQLADYVNAFAQKMKMGREVIADKGIWTAKKRYALNVYDSEGVRFTEPYIKAMGLETVKSSTPEVCRNKLKEALKLIMMGDENQVIDFISDFKKEFYEMSAEDIAFPRSANNLVKWHCSTNIYRKSTPIHVKGSLVFNHMLRERDLTKKYRLIEDGEKVRYVMLKLPNKSHNKVISFIDKLPDEFELKESIDYALQFEKSFLDPLKAILTAIGWNYERKTTLEAFFV